MVDDGEILQRLARIERIANALHAIGNEILRRQEEQSVSHTNEQSVEQSIQAKGLNAPRLTPQRIDAVIVGETYTVLPSGKVMVCELTLRNGFTVRGEAAVVSKENFDEGIGRRISRENARAKVWELECYLLQESLSNG